MKLRLELVLNLVIAMVLMADVFVVLQIYQQRTEPPPIQPLTASIQATPVTAPETDTSPTPTGGDEDTDEGALALATATKVQQDLRAALFGAKAAFVENGAFPTSAGELAHLVPGLQLSNGLEGVGEGTIGMVANQTTILFVSSAGEEEWFCIAADGQGGTTFYDRGRNVGEVSSFAACNASTAGW